jgi:hypothetical protein
MALQIAQYNLELTLTGIPANREYSFVGSNSYLILPTDKNVLIKKISLDAVYNNSGDIVLIDYQLRFLYINQDNISLSANKAIITTGLLPAVTIPFLLNKSNPIINSNVIAGGLLFQNNINQLSSLILNNSTSALTSTVSFLVTIYYE